MRTVKCLCIGKKSILNHIVKSAITSVFLRADRACRPIYLDEKFPWKEFSEDSIILHKFLIAAHFPAKKTFYSNHDMKNVVRRTDEGRT